MLYTVRLKATVMWITKVEARNAEEAYRKAEQLDDDMAKLYADVKCRKVIESVESEDGEFFFGSDLERYMSEGFSLRVRLLRLALIFVLGFSTALGLVKGVGWWHLPDLIHPSSRPGVLRGCGYGFGLFIRAYFPLVLAGRSAFFIHRFAGQIMQEE
jgi:hypothetical protein